MRGSDALAAVQPRRSGEEIVARLSSGHLKRLSARARDAHHVPPAHDELDAEPGRGPANKIFVPVGVEPAQTVVEVADGEPDAELRGQLMNRGKQRHGIRAAGNAEQHPLSPPEELMLPRAAPDVL